MSDAFNMTDAPQGPRRRRTRRSPVKRAAALLMLALVLGMVVGIVLLAVSFRPGKDIKAGQTVRVTIPTGSDTGQISTILEDEGVIGNHVVFSARLRLNGDDRSFKAGAYRMKTGSSYQTVVRQLVAGPPPSPVYHVVIPEGFRIVDSATRIDSIRAEQSAKGVVKVLPPFSGAQYSAAVKAIRPSATLKAPAGTKSMEGLLFPATYELLKSGTAPEFARKQLDAFNTNLANIDMTYATKHGLTPYDVVIIASMVEREARVSQDRPHIASVIYNRLKLRMTLGIDATIQYAVSGPDGWKTSLKQSDLEIDSPYNSRLNVGLPPTPIASPGLASLQAAAKPAAGDDLYYVADPAGTGKHHFYKTLDDFNSDPWTHAS
ncbi:MAG: endolytic transglycosylase MltG [Thermoleophilia bacterium]|nr:endolytic transglycosylase MltG [Thermoleophilia bacterium]